MLFDYWCYAETVL